METTNRSNIYAEPGQRGSANLTAADRPKREPANVRCTICGRPIADCTIGGMHGMVRDRAAAAMRQIIAEK